MDADKKIMLLENVKTLFIQETSCFHNKELIETLEKLIKETGFNGNVIVRRNKNYDKELIFCQEIDAERLNRNTTKNIFNSYSSSGYEYIVCNKEGCKCITENEAREIMGGSYKQNLDFNKKHGLGDKPANPKCQPEMDEINKKYLSKNIGIKNNVAESNDEFKEVIGQNGFEDL